MMEWILRSPQVHSTFAKLGYVTADGYHINENCNETLEYILKNILMEDKYLRTYRRSISFGQNIQKDIIPLIIETKDDKTVELLIKILVNLTIPIECLFSVEAISRTDVGRHAIFEINNLLDATKSAFTDHRVPKVLVDFLKKNVDLEQSVKLTPEQSGNVANALLLLRNVLHIPEEHAGAATNHTVQNRILGNFFSQSIDKVLIKLMTIPEAAHWSVTMVQLVALLYKEQHVTTLTKLLNVWLEASQSDSSEDNESNTSPPDRGSEDSSPMLTSDPTSDSSDNGPKSNQGANAEDGKWRDPAAAGEAGVAGPAAPPPADGAPPPVDPAEVPLPDSDDDPMSVSTADPAVLTPPATAALPPPDPAPPPTPPAPPAAASEPPAKTTTVQSSPGTKRKHDDSKVSSSSEDVQSDRSMAEPSSASKEEKSVSASDCGYGTQVETQEVSTSSNEDEPQKPVHQKPHNPKQKPNTKVRCGTTLQDKRRKKIVKRSRTTIINVQGLARKIPTDDDISNILKEFTVDFLLKGYNSLVRTLYTQIITNLDLEIDTSHFFWLVTYFLKFASQIELDLEHVCSVLSFDIITYLTAEGVNLCEQFALAIKLDGNDLKPCIRRMHLVVTAIREFVQALEVYKKLSVYSSENEETLAQLQLKVCELDELKTLMVLLLRHYNPSLHTKQYLQDLIVTNHILLMFVDSVLKTPNYTGSTNMVTHLKQFATPEMMNQYGILLEDFAKNGEFVNDCIFTVMHHVAGELESLYALCQPRILTTFTAIWKAEFEICDDWSDLIEYAINTFIKKPQSLRAVNNFRLDTENFDDDSESTKPHVASDIKVDFDDMKKEDFDDSLMPGDAAEKWTDAELSSLRWNYMQCCESSDLIADIVKIYAEEGSCKRRESVIQELLKQNIITKADYDCFLKVEIRRTTKNNQMNKETRDSEIAKLCEQLYQDGNGKMLQWVQQVLLETCYAKIYLDKKSLKAYEEAAQAPGDRKVHKFGLFKKKDDDLPLISPVSYHSLLQDKSVPLVAWNYEQVMICKDFKFLQLLHKLGFHMPVDTGKLFIRIPHFWSADYLYEVAGKILPIDTSKLKFSKTDISAEPVPTNTPYMNSFTLTADYIRKDYTYMGSPENFYQIQKDSHLATMINYTPMPGASFEGEAASAGETNKTCWLEIVQRSQQLKISLRMKNGCTDIPSDVSARVSEAAPPPPAALLESVLAPPPGQDDDDDSVCDTASVASNLTRMYVSDEDEICELMPRLLTPVLPHDYLETFEPLPLPVDSDRAAMPPPLEPRPPPSPRSDSDCCAGKRPRVHLSPMF
ncbi:protein timeless isoform X2 [Plutella xylostella]|uniref:protein timeless isoform X2 n=1 Tax=Plutella xylostella TaxID=51655 RepID=UPI002032ACDE|nr:protein timeless isoform X2 [Plutella xylostella]